MTSSELQLRNSQLEVIRNEEVEDISELNEYGELMNEQDLTKKKVKMNLLQSMLLHSKKYIDTSTNQDIQKKMQLIQQRVFWRATNDSNTYFHKLFQQLKQNHPNMPETIAKVENINTKMTGLIKSGKLQINKRHSVLNKSELYALESSFYKRRLSNNKLSLQHKILSLDNHIDYLKSLRQPDGLLDKSLSTRVMHKSVHNLSSDQFQLFSQKTQDAKHFLREIKKHSELTKAEIEEKKKKEEEKKQKMKEKIEIEKEEERRKRHDTFLTSYHTQRELQKQREELNSKNEVEFQQFYKNYKEKKPLYEIMEEQYTQKYQIQVQQDKLSKLRDIYKPHRLEDFEDHYKKYKKIFKFKLKEW